MSEPALADLVGDVAAEHLAHFGIIEASQLQGMLAHAGVRARLGGLLGLDEAGLAALGARLAAGDLDPAALTPPVRPPSGVHLPGERADG